MSAPFAKIPDPVPPVKPQKPPKVTLINAAAYSHASKLEGSKCFQLQISLPKVTGHSATTSEILVDMNSVPKDYHDFTDMFSKSKAGKLADHRPYNLKITLDKGTFLPMVLFTPGPRRNLWLCISSLTKTLPQG